MQLRARHESGYLRRYLRVNPWENPCKRITHVRVTWHLKNPRVRVSILDHTQPVQVTRTTRGPIVCFSKHSCTTYHLKIYEQQQGSASPTPIALATVAALAFALALALALAL